MACWDVVGVAVEDEVQDAVNVGDDVRAWVPVAVEDVVCEEDAPCDIVKLGEPDAVVFCDALDDALVVAVGVSVGVVVQESLCDAVMDSLEVLVGVCDGVGDGEGVGVGVTLLVPDGEPLCVADGDTLGVGLSVERCEAVPDSDVV